VNSQGRMATWRLILSVTTLGIAIITLHFHGLLTVPLNDFIWGISISADPVGDLHLVHDFLMQAERGCINHVTSHSYPFGSMGFIGPNRYFGPGFIVFTALAKLSGKLVGSFNVAIMLLMLVNMIVTYFATRSLLRDNLTALIPAILVTFSAYSYAHSWAHIGLMPIFYFPCFLTAFSALQAGKQDRRQILIAAILMAATAYATPYYLYINIWLAVAIFAGYVIAAPKTMLTRKSFLANMNCAIIAIALIMPFIYLSFFQDMSDGWYQDPAQNYGGSLYFLYNYSARPSDYFLPNVHNRFFGTFFRPFIADANNARNYWSDELPISIGLLPSLFVCLLSVAFIGRLPFLDRRFRVITDKYLAPIWKAKKRNPGLVNGLILAMILSFLISLPPTLTYFGQQIPMPNELLRHIVPFRSYSRFAILFLVALTTLIALVVQETKRPKIYTCLLLGLGVFEATPSTMLHKASESARYIQYLRNRSEQVIMRFEKQNIEIKRAIDLEVVLSGKKTINGDVNMNYGYTDWPLLPQFPAINFGQLGQLGAELLLVNGKLQVPVKERSYLTLLAEFPEDDIQIWKIIPGSDVRLDALFKPFKERNAVDACYVASKPEVAAALAAFGRIVSS